MHDQIKYCQLDEEHKRKVISIIPNVLDRIELTIVFQVLNKQVAYHSNCQIENEQIKLGRHA